MTEHEDRARAVKASHLVAHLISTHRICADEFDRQVFVDLVQLAGDEAWSVWAQGAGTREPSLATRAVVVEQLRRWESRADADPFAGLPR